MEHWDGKTHIHTLSLLAVDDEVALKARLWDVRVRVVYPFINMIRMAFIAKYDLRLKAALPYTKAHSYERCMERNISFRILGHQFGRR